MVMNFKGSQRSISKDLTIGLILVVLVVSSIAMLTAYYASKKKAESELEAKADEYIVFLKDTLVLPLWNYDFETIDAVCRTYLQNDLITGIKVNDRRKKVDINLVKENSSPSVTRTVDLVRYNIPIGKVHISLTYGYLTQWNRQLFMSFGFTILINLITLLILTGILLRMSLKRPLDRLNSIVDSYAAGEPPSFSQDVPHSELRPLVNTLDQMGSKIELQVSTIQAAEKKYRSIFENAIEGIYQSTSDGRMLSANPAFARILGFESSGQLIEAINETGPLHWVDPGQRRAFVKQLTSEDGLTSFETRMYRRDRSVIWVSINGRPVYDDFGNLHHLEGMVQDITERKQAESQLRRLFTAVEHAADSIYITNEEGLIDYVNPAFERTTGYGREEVLGQEPGLLGADRREASLYKEIWATVSDGRVWTGRIRNKGKGDIGFIVEATVSPIKSRSGLIIGCAAVSRDVTEQVRLEGQLRQTQKIEAIGTLAGGIAHDFNNMLGVIIGCSELAMDGIEEVSLPRADMERVLDAGLRAKALVRQILTFSRQGESELKPLILQPFIKEVVKFLQTTLPPSVEIKLTMGSGSHSVMADPTQLQQVLMNLCTNSAHALEPEGGAIDISLAEQFLDEKEAEALSELNPGPYLNLTVSDNGRGIPEENLHRIFDPFFTTKSVGEGTGLGLSVVHGIVKNHGGAVLVKSETGSGTLVQVLLPSLEHPEIDAASEAAVEPPEGDEEIMLVEDERILADIIKRILTGLGYGVKVFYTSAEALKYFKDNPERFDLALLDQNIPETTGIEISRIVKESRPSIKIILYTGMSIEPLEKDAQAAGVGEIINKPLNRIELAAAIRRVLDERE